MTARLRLREALAPAVDEMLEPFVRVERSLYPIDDLGAIEQQLQAAPLKKRRSGLRQAIFSDQDNSTEIKASNALDKIDEFCAVTWRRRRSARRASPASTRVDGLQRRQSKFSEVVDVERQQVRNRRLSRARRRATRIGPHRQPIKRQIRETRRRRRVRLRHLARGQDVQRLRLRQDGPVEFAFEDMRAMMGSLCSRTCSPNHYRRSRRRSSRTTGRCARIS